MSLIGKKITVTFDQGSLQKIDFFEIRLQISTVIFVTESGLY